MEKKKKNKSFEDIIHNLENVVNQLEESEVTLDKSIELYEKGMKLIGIAENYLNNAEAKIKIITKENNLKDFNNE